MHLSTAAFPETATVSGWPGNVLVIGSGLVGASLAALIRQVDDEQGGTKRSRVVVHDLCAEHARAAVAAGHADAAAIDLPSAAATADLIVLAVPARAVRPVLRTLAGAAPSRAVIVDMGSVKADFACAAAHILSPDQLARTVPCHPVAGGTASGPAMAGAQVLRGCRMVLTPSQGCDERVLEGLLDFWRALGFACVVMSPERHDRVYAVLSHLPHLLSFALLRQGRSLFDDPAMLASLRGNAFDLMTRMARSNPALWAEILGANREEVLFGLTELRSILAEIETNLRGDDAAALARALAPEGEMTA